MNKKLTLVLGILLGLIVMGCDDDETSKSALLSFAKTGCKTVASSRSADAGSLSDLYGEWAEAFLYEGTSDKGLFVTHQNAVFSCEADIKVTVNVEGRVITITEEATTGSNCLCPYDLTMKIGPLTEGLYQVNIVKGNLDWFSFTIDYKPEVKGKEVM